MQYKKDILEFSCYGLEIRCDEIVSLENTSTSETTETQLTPQLTPKSRKEIEIDTQNLPADLAEIVVVWHQLPSAIRSAIVAIVLTSKE